ncbi:DUF2489 domain-containing protein [Shewanella surugensis]|uniref:DUF2489 domain-containing protein n=1 Tax=Shewanella surugensis TaxID=212020 RepID=A0ABT0L9N4_9GAMM|nr:DUF2489 domain-containing protein [Shewanella surugensis]MCL1124428.1 DUF2489 domain-containing protein [Shewanella surugensis]
MFNIFTILGLVIIALLSGYAISLVLKLKQQKLLTKQVQQQQKAANERLEKLLDNIRYIAQAMLEERCELSEGVMRIAKLFDILGLSSKVALDYPVLFKHYNKIKDHPIKDQRKSLSKQQRMQLDYQRMCSESDLESAILEEVKRLIHL